MNIKKWVFGLMLFGILSNVALAGAKQVKVCNVLRNYEASVMKLACEGNYDNKTTLKKMYAKGWRYVGVVVIDGGQVILEK